MPFSRTSLTLAAGLALAATAAFAAPVQSLPDRDRPAPQAADDARPDTNQKGKCPTPNAAKCMSKTRVGGEDVAYLETACGIEHRDTCKPSVSAAFERWSPPHKTTTRSFVPVESLAWATRSVATTSRAC